MDEYITKREAINAILDWATVLNSPKYLIREDAVTAIDALKGINVLDVKLSASKEDVMDGKTFFVEAGGVLFKVKKAEVSEETGVKTVVGKIRLGSSAPEDPYMGMSYGDYWGKEY